mgnify:CR=1 FL=1
MRSARATAGEQPLTLLVCGLTDLKCSSLPRLVPRSEQASYRRPEQLVRCPSIRPVALLPHVLRCVPRTGAWTLWLTDAPVGSRACSPPVGTSVADVSSYLVGTKFFLNKGEMENLYLHFGSVEEGVVDLVAFFVELDSDLSGKDPIFLSQTGQSPNTAHLNLSGVSHLEFAEQYKPFPAHWGVPPNAQMKGHNGIMRDLPGGYGKGNAPMANWVRENMAKDKNNFTNERGNSPFPLGNYSLGCTGITR